MADRPEQETPDPLSILAAGIELVLRAEPGMTMPCLRTFLAVCGFCEREGTGITMTRLAPMVGAYGTRRTNVTRHLQFLRDRDMVGTAKDSADLRYDYHSPTQNGWDFYDALRDRLTRRLAAGDIRAEPGPGPGDDGRD